MTELQKLLAILLAENHNREGLQIPEAVSQQRQLLRALMNIRLPKPLSREAIILQDKELQRQLAEKGVVDITGKGMILWQGDITRLNVDAIVNAANSKMLGCFVPGHHCKDNAIHSAAGMQLRLECEDIMKGREADTAEVIVTKVYNLPSKFVFHVTGPIIPNGIPTQRQVQQLKDCYTNCLTESDHLGVESIAYCRLSTGVFRFPSELAAQIAVESVRDYFHKGSGSVKMVVFNVFKNKDLEIYQRLLDEWK